MRCAQLAAINQLTVVDQPDPAPGPGEAVVRLKAAALNHRDLWIKLGQYAGLTFPCTPGSDGAGVVESVGAGVEGSWIGSEVVINPSLGWGVQESAQGPEFSILGLPRAGTLAERVVVPAGQLAAKPAHLSWEEAAALPLAGLTAYRALFCRAQLKAGERILITGIGGGVALFALQFATAQGAEPQVTSSSSDKIQRAGGLGSRGGFNYLQADWKAQALKAGPFDVIIDSAGGADFDALLDLAAPGGRLAFFGATRGNPPGLPLRKVFWRQLSLLGSTMGSPSDWAAMTAFVALHRIRPVISEVFSLDEVSAAFALMERGGQFGKIVIRM
jgi:zinc-binding alcohol dehydrogenase/oxidoreductase